MCLANERVRGVASTKAREVMFFIEGSALGACHLAGTLGTTIPKNLVIRGCETTRSLFTSVTHLLVVLNKNNATQNRTRTAREEFELQEVIVQRPPITNSILKNSTIQKKVEFEIQFSEPLWFWF